MTRDQLVAWMNDPQPHAYGAARGCEEARKWIEATPGGPKELWKVCPSGIWMDWGLWELNHSTYNIDGIGQDVIDALDAAYNTTYKVAWARAKHNAALDAAWADAIRKALPWSRVEPLLKKVTL